MYQLVVNDHKNVTRLQEFMGTIKSWLRRSLVTRYISDMTVLQMNLGCFLFHFNFFYYYKF